MQLPLLSHINLIKQTQFILQRIIYEPFILYYQLFQIKQGQMPPKKSQTLQTNDSNKQSMIRKQFIIKKKQKYDTDLQSLPSLSLGVCRDVYSLIKNREQSQKQQSRRKSQYKSRFQIFFDDLRAKAKERKMKKIKFLTEDEYEQSEIENQQLKLFSKPNQFISNDQFQKNYQMIDTESRKMSKTIQQNKKPIQNQNGTFMLKSLNTQKLQFNSFAEKIQKRIKKQTNIEQQVLNDFIHLEIFSRQRHEISQRKINQEKDISFLQQQEREGR